MEEDFPLEEEFWKCRKHPSQLRYGVCPGCLRERLLLLCPDCANVLPCGCWPSSSSSSSFSSLSSSDLFRSSVSGGIGAVGRVSNLLDSEPAFRRSGSAAFPRSRSAAFQFLRPGSNPAAAVCEWPRPEEGWRWAGFWPFSRSAARKEVKEARRLADTKISRSRSLGVTFFPDSGGGDGKLKGWNWHFPSPIKAFRRRKTSKVVQERSPLCRG